MQLVPTDRTVHVVFVTSVLQMEVDLPGSNATLTEHYIYGAPHSVEDYYQEHGMSD